MANSPRLAELADLITRREYNYAMCKARKHEEDLVRRYAMDHNIEYTTLADTIEELYQEGIIGDASRENLHGIRIIGNKAVHQEDNDANDAKSAYDMLKRELTTYSDQKYTNPVRTPVALNRNEEPDYGMRRRVREREEDKEETGELDVSYAGGGRRTREAAQNRGGGSRRPSRGNDGSALYTILKILIPVLIVVLLFILIKSMFPKKTVEPETTTAVTTEAVTETETETTVPPTTEPPTTEPPTTEAPKTYQTKGEGVRFRFASDPGQIYTTVAPGTFIGSITDYENKTGKSDYDNFAQFTYDGKTLIVRKDLIEETSGN